MTAEALYFISDCTEVQPMARSNASGAGAKIFYFGDVYDRRRARVMKTMHMGVGLDARGVTEEFDAPTAGVLAAIAGLRAAIEAGINDSIEIDLDALARETDDDPEWTAFISRSWND